MFATSIKVLPIRLSFWACSLLLLTVSGTVCGRALYVVRPPQSWVRTISSNPGAQSKQTQPTGSSTFLLDDHQVRVSKETVERYYHHVQKIDTAAGLDDFSQLKFYFEPSYQQLAIHFIRILRDGAAIDALRPSEIKVIQQEEELNQQLYNGTLAALVFLNDLRVGDIVDYSYTITGENRYLGDDLLRLSTWATGSQSRISRLDSFVPRSEFSRYETPTSRYNPKFTLQETIRSIFGRDGMLQGLLSKIPYLDGSILIQV
jgi:hypothetical protein